MTIDVTVLVTVIVVLNALTLHHPSITSWSVGLSWLVGLLVEAVSVTVQTIEFVATQTEDQNDGATRFRLDVSDVLQRRTCTRLFG
jgi:hypothetical protein